MGLRDMERGKQQVLFNYLPEATFDYEGGNLICRVTQVEGIPARDISEQRIKEEMHRYIYGTLNSPRWEPEYVKGFPKNIYESAIDLEFLEPTRVRFEVFPTVYRCIKCSRVYVYSDLHELARKNKKQKCMVCQAPLRQLYHVFIHECGCIEPVSWEYPCSVHRKSPMVFNDMRSQHARDFKWVCSESGCNKTYSFYKKCPHCSTDTEKKGMYAVPHRANSAYYPHYVRLIDIAGSHKVCFDDYSARRLFSSYFKIENDQTLNPAVIEDIKKNLEDESLPLEIRNHYLQRINKATENSSSIDDELIERVSKSNVIKQINEYQSIFSELSIVSIPEMIDELNTIKPGMGGKLEISPETINKCGLKDVYLIKDFPVVTAVFGYTRGWFEPQAETEKRTVYTTFRAFPTRRPGTTKRPIYVDKGEAEALLFVLDPVSITQWLFQNNIIDTTFNDDLTARAFLLKNITHVDRFAEIPNDEIITKMVFGLVHSMSHSIIKTMAVMSGFESTGIAEYLFPSVPAFIIYSNKTDFSVGGMYTIFEEYLPELLEKAAKDIESQICVYDPVCIEHGGSCHACLHLPEISCAHLNRGMSRSYLFGGNIGGQKISGYWEHI